MISGPDLPDQIGPGQGRNGKKKLAQNGFECKEWADDVNRSDPPYFKNFTYFKAVYVLLLNNLFFGIFSAHIVWVGYTPFFVLL